MWENDLKFIIWLKCENFDIQKFSNDILNLMYKSWQAGKELENQSFRPIEHESVENEKFLEIERNRKWLEGYKKWIQEKNY